MRFTRTSSRLAGSVAAAVSAAAVAALTITAPATAAPTWAPADTAEILPPRITIDPRSMTVPLPTMMRAFVIAMSCACPSGAQQSQLSKARAEAVGRLISCFPS